MAVTLAVTSAVRSTLLPEVPTIAEAALPGFEAVLRYGLVAPPGTPRAIIEKLNTALNTVLASQDVRARLAIEGAEPLPSTPAEYGGHRPRGNPVVEGREGFRRQGGVAGRAERRSGYGRHILSVRGMDRAHRDNPR